MPTKETTKPSTMAADDTAPKRLSQDLDALTAGDDQEIARGHPALVIGLRVQACRNRHNRSHQWPRPRLVRLKDGAREHLPQAMGHGHLLWRQGARTGITMPRSGMSDPIATTAGAAIRPCKNRRRFMVRSVTLRGGPRVSRRYPNTPSLWYHNTSIVGILTPLQVS